MTDLYETEREVVERVAERQTAIRRELAKVIVGQEEVIEQLLVALFAGGHCLLTGAPGLAKTLLVRSVASIFHLDFQRIQFTPDLMPADILGTEILQEAADGSRELHFVRGPICTGAACSGRRAPASTRRPSSRTAGTCSWAR